MEKTCGNCGHKNKYDCTPCAHCLFESNWCESAPKTNADRIRGMSDEELAEFLGEYEVCDNCEYRSGERCTFENPCVKEFAKAVAYEWLRSEVEEDDGKETPNEK